MHSCERGKRSIICDVQRNKFDFIPNGLYQILKEYEILKFDGIKQDYNHEFDATLDQYFDFLVKNEYIFECSDLDACCFPPIDLKWDEPFKITNCIIDVNNGSNHDFVNIFSQLEEIMCPFIQLRFYSKVSIEQLNSIFSKLNGSSIISVELVMPQSSDLSTDVLKKLMNNFPRVNLIFIHSAEKYKMIEKADGQAGNIILVPDKIDSALHCGKISYKTFSVNLKTFSESQKYNTCLNRKLSIDVKGEIRNCPSMPESFGNILDTKILDVLKEERFIRMWDISKDKIESCKDCEFRFICTDCRAYILNNDNIYSKPSKCPYDPYTAKGF
ncbi:MAG: grasp-with-spasm system SPASM domain peptide maturase [Chloroflexia bacterium]|nr:grasp-with-spasm system SPASM domain peptide maturase [Chloroflexia bacterium]